jgi:DNA helicase II / ATP-dependent DNA helicase PcrA
MSEILNNLTDAQRQAVTHIEGPILVLAGPGSGKTRVIVQRVAYLINQGVAPRNILAITFTNKAAQEMRDRLIAQQIGRGSTICTFHSLAARLLREFAAEVGISANFSIYDTADQKAAMLTALKVCEFDSHNFPPARMLARISGYKNDLLTPDQLIKTNEFDFYTEKMARIYQAYQDQLTLNVAVDFDDLLMKLAFLLRDKPQVRDALNARYRFVLVDEYQDTNHCQYQIARGLALQHSNLFVTGDPDQSIYGWRGADIGNILAFEEDYPNAKLVRLEENFRSIPQILSVADELIRVNQQRKHKQLFTSKADGEMPRLFEFYNEYEEAAGMVQWVRQLRQQSREYRDMAVFYRVNSMSRILEEALRKGGIPYQIVRGVEFFQRREIKDMIAYLRLLINPVDTVTLKRVINQPARGIGTTTVERLFSYSETTGKNIWQTLNSVEEVSSLNAAARVRIKNFTQMIIDLQGQLNNPVAYIMTQVCEKTGMKESLAAEKTEEPAANVAELINSAVQFDSENEQPTLAEYLQQIALVSDSDAYDAQAGAVSLMTLHSAKGLEFPAVFIIGVEDGLIPHTRSVSSEQDVEEERRLLFVGITRAQEHLALSYSRNRTIQGASLATIRSEFLRNLSGLQYCDLSTEQNPEQPEEDSSFDDNGDDSPDYDNDGIAGFALGQLVRHPSLGIGRIERLMPARDDSRVIVQFKSGARKTLVLKYARLEKLDYSD